MYKILLIDKGNSSIHSFQDVLKDRGFSLVKVHSLKEAFPFLKNNVVDLIVVDRIFSVNTNDFKKFKKLTNSTSKIVFTHDQSFRGMGPWLKDKLVIPVHEPISFREFEYHMKRIFGNKEIIVPAIEKSTENDADCNDENFSALFWHFTFQL